MKHQNTRNDFHSSRLLRSRGALNITLSEVVKLLSPPRTPNADNSVLLSRRHSLLSPVSPAHANSQSPSSVRSLAYAIKQSQSSTPKQALVKGLNLIERIFGPAPSSDRKMKIPTIQIIPDVQTPSDKSPVKILLKEPVVSTEKKTPTSTMLDLQYFEAHSRKVRRKPNLSETALLEEIKLDLTPKKSSAFRRSSTIKKFSVNQKSVSLPKLHHEFKKSKTSYFT